MSTLTESPQRLLVDELTRREFLTGLAAAGLLAACSRAPSFTPGGQTRTIATDNGPLDVPADPKRVVAAIGSFEIDMVAVGVMPVLTTTFAGPWVELDDGVTITDNIPPTPEELVGVRPDLIVGWNWVTEEPSFDEISAIAPYAGLGESETTAGPGFDSSRPLESWNHLFLTVADAVNRKEAGEKMVAQFEQRLKDLAARRSSEPPVRVARLEFYQAGSFSYRGQNEDTAELMRRIGLEVVGPQQTVHQESLERLPDIDADWLVIPTGGESIPRALYDEMAATDLFQAIPAARANRVHLVDANLWPGLGHLWARAVVNDLERLFVPA